MSVSTPTPRPQVDAPQQPEKNGKRQLLFHFIFF